MRKTVKGQYPDASEEHQKAIAGKVMSGSSIDSFKIEEGRLWTVHNRAASYWRASGAWSREPMNTDAAQIYAPQRLEIEQAYPEFGFTLCKSMN